MKPCSTILGAGAPLLPRRYADRLRMSKVDHDGTFVFLTYDVIAADGNNGDTSTSTSHRSDDRVRS